MYPATRPEAAPGPARIDSGIRRAFAWFPGRTPQLWSDLTLGAAFAVVAAMLSWRLYDVLRPMAIGDEQWFQADLGRVFAILTDRYSDFHERSRIHPLYALVNTPGVYALMRAFRLDPLAAVRLWTAGTAGLFGAVCFAGARALDLRRADAAIATALTLSSGAALLWLPTPETYAAGSITILLCVTAGGLTVKRRLGDLPLVATAAAAFSITITNAMAGIALLVSVRPLRRALQLTVNAFFLVAMLQVVQNVIFPTTHGMTELRSEQRFLLDRSAGTQLDKLRAMLVHSVVLPVAVTPLEFDTRTPLVSFQQSAIGSSGAAGLSASVLWLGLVALGAWCLAIRARTHTASAVCGLTAIGQLALHLVYGDQTFLYALHFTPLLILVAAHGVFGPAARWTRGALVLLLALLVLNNAQQVVQIAALLDRISVVPR